MRSLFGYLLRRSWLALLISILGGIISGLSGVCLLAVINYTLDHPGDNLLWPVFIPLCLTFVVGRFLSEYILTVLGQNSIRELRVELSKRVIGLPLSKVQTLGAANILANLTHDISEISQAFTRMPVVCANTAVMVGCVIYMGWLSIELLWLVLATMAVGVISFKAVQRQAYRFLKAARDSEDLVYGHFRNMVDGIKELKLNQGRRRAFFSGCVEATVNECRKNQLKAMLLYAVAINWGNVLFYLVIGSILFVIPLVHELVPDIARAYCLVILYMTWPLPQLLESVALISKAGVAATKLSRLNNNIMIGLEAGNVVAPYLTRNPTPILEFSQVRYSYNGEDKRFEFTLGPLDLTLHPGELVFLIGGNGSGKSTLALLLVGLYRPESGTIRLGGELICEDKVEYYRQHFSAVFVDFFLFDRLLGFESFEIDNKVRKYLELLDLDHKVGVEQGQFSTLDLSQGQRKRLALLVAYMEDRPFYVFDEWAADQDPVFKKVFYCEILASLKSRGKTVFVITHDDSYFWRADRCLKLQDGKLFEVKLAKASVTHGKVDSGSVHVAAMPDFRDDA